MLCFTKSGTDRTVRPVALEADAEHNEEDVHSNSSVEDNCLNDSAASEDSQVGDADTDSAQASAVITNEEAQQASQNLENGAKAEAFEEDLHITALESTTSAHDDWLHRGPFLFDMDFHTYIRFTVRKPRPKDLKVSDADRAQHVFLFDSHYALAASHCCATVAH